jgi:hypothetical protein
MTTTTQPPPPQHTMRHPICQQPVSILYDQPTCEAVHRLFRGCGQPFSSLFTTADDLRLAESFAEAARSGQERRAFGAHCVRHAASMSPKGLALAYVYERSIGGVPAHVALAELQVDTPPPAPESYGKALAPRKPRPPRSPPKTRHLQATRTHRSQRGGVRTAGKKPPQRRQTPSSEPAAQP